LEVVELGQQLQLLFKVVMVELLFLTLQLLMRLQEELLLLGEEAAVLIQIKVVYLAVPGAVVITLAVIVVLEHQDKAMQVGLELLANLITVVLEAEVLEL
jgi:hypothetical protein